jgi:hypothetical protein
MTENLQTHIIVYKEFLAHAKVLDEYIETILSSDKILKSAIAQRSFRTTY